MRFAERRKTAIANLFGRLFNKPGTGKNAAVFIDYEHWYISLEKNYHLKPNIQEFTDNLREKYNVEDLVFFGDFSNASLNNEMHKIRGFTNRIVETNNGGGFYKKDFTDFIMLDHIYQSAYTDKSIDTYVIFTGDGHFSSAVLFLKNVCRKNVVVYGVRNAFSGQLKTASSEWHEIPSEKDELLPYCRMILVSLYALETENKNARPTFIRTVDAVSEKYNANKDMLRTAMESLITDGYVSQYERQIRFKTVRLLKTDFDKCEKDGLFRPGMTVKPFAQNSQNQQ